MSSYRRPRRTRIYDSNYNIGTNYYKPALDTIDAKYSSPRILRESSLPKAKINFSLGEDSATLSEARERAHRAITEETVFDSKGFRIPKSGIPLTSEIEASFDADIQSSINRLRADRGTNITVQAKKMQYDSDLDFELPKRSSFLRKAESEINDAIHGTSGLSESSNFIKKRALKLVSTTSSVDSAIDSNNLTKWTKLSASDDSHSLAKQRALETKARLQEIEDDIVTRQERQVARERRAANLRKMINEEFNINGVDEEMKALAY